MARALSLSPSEGRGLGERSPFDRFVPSWFPVPMHARSEKGLSLIHLSRLTALPKVIKSNQK
jgi:hypothetical protein